MLNVTYENITRIKRLSLPRILESKGITLKKTNGNGSYLALCPFHDDKNPSLSVSLKDGVWLWHCFGCHKGGSVIDFLKYYEGRSFKDVYNNYSNTDKDTKSLLKDIVLFYHDTLKKSPCAQAYLKERALLDKDLIETFKIGYCDGTAKDTLTGNKAAQEILKEAGILNERLNESFYKCVTVPIFDKDTSPAGLYGRGIKKKRHLYLKGPHRGVFNHNALKAYDEVILTEGIIDSLTLYKQGFLNTTSSFGTNGFTDGHLAAFRENNVKCVYIAYDNDEAGERAARALAGRLADEGIDVKRINLPQGVKDINDYFKTYTKDSFSALLKGACGLGPSPARKEKGEGLVFYKDKEASFKYSSVDYHIKGLDVKEEAGLRVIILARRGDCRCQDRFDLYSAKSRSMFINQLGRRLNIDKEKAEENLLNIIEEIESIKTLEAGKANDHQATYHMTDEEVREAEDFLNDPGLIERILRDIETSGYVGEDENKLITYLVATSRKLDKPLSCVMISQSSSGKSHLMETIASLMPDEEVEFYSRITPQSLYYMERGALKHKLLIIDERSGSEEADYAVRSLQTRHKLILAYPVKDPNSGRMKTIVVIMEGPISFMESSTKDKLNPENMSRSFQLYLDESERQTQRIQEYQRFIRGIDGWRLLDKRPSIVRLHKNGQRLLKPVKIIIPYLDRIKFPSRWMRTRRDQDRFLSLIEAVTFLYQYQRRVKEDSRGKPYIEAAAKDYEVAYNLASRVLTETLSDLTGTTRAFYEALERAVSERSRGSSDAFEFKRRDVREWLRLPDHYVKRQISILEDLEYVSCARSFKGGSFKYRLLERASKDGYISNLTPPYELQKSGTK